MSKITKVIYCCKFGGFKYLIYKVLDKLIGGNRAFELRYNILSEADESEYPQLLEKLYGASAGDKLHLNAPVTFNEKIQWVKIYDRNPLRTQLADKYRVREWVADKIGEEYLIPLIGVWDKFDDIDFSQLPKQFVLKLNNASGANLIVTDKDKLDIDEARDKFNKWMKINFAYYCLDLHYRDIVPKIIAEKYMAQNNDELSDYKFMCFDGDVKYFWIDRDRFTNHRRYVFDTNGNFLNYRIDHKNTGDIPEIPSNYKEMIKLAAKLSEGFAHVRVDLYNINGTIYFGEMTFTTDGGYSKFTPKEFNLELGSYMNIPINS